MRAVCWFGTHDVRVENVPDPTILNPQDAIIKVTLTAICGSDLHLYNGVIPTMQRGDILGHEFVGEVVEVGRGVKKLKRGDRVVVPFPIACGRCFFCEKELYAACDNSNSQAWLSEKAYGRPVAGIFGYSHLMGGYAGGQAEYVRVPFADVGPMKVPDSLTDEQVLFLTDIFPTGYMAAENCNIQSGDVVAADKFPIGAAFGKGLTLKMGQTHVHRYLRPLLSHIEAGDIDPTFVISHRLPLSKAAEAYHIFKERQDQCIKVVLQP